MNRESGLQKAILEAISYHPRATVIMIPPRAKGPEARRYFRNGIERFENIKGPAVAVWRVNSGSIKAEHGEARYRVTLPGTFDLAFVVKPWGVFGQWEVKTADGKMNPNQRVNARLLRAAGVIHGELRSTEDAMAAIDEAIGICERRFSG